MSATTIGREKTDAPGPWSPGPLLPALACWAVSFAIRVWMSHALRGSQLWDFQGACRDAVPAVLLAALLYRFDPQGLRKISLSLLLSFWTMALFFLSVSDGVYFFQCDRRLDSALVENLSLTSIAPAETPGVISAVAGLAVLLALLGWGAWLLAHRPHGVRQGTRGYRFRMAVCVAVLLCAAVPWARALTPAPDNAVQERTEQWLKDGEAENAAGIAMTLWRTGPDWQKPAPSALDDSDRVWAEDQGLVPGLVSSAEHPRRWKRVVVVAVESLAAAFLDPGNPRRPKGMTPFLDSLLRAYPHLENCYSAGVDTDQGQYALMCGRTDFEWGGHPYPGPTLFSLARGAGYATCMLYGDTDSFRDHENAYPETLHIDHQYSRESFEGTLPKADFCSWGGALCDHAVLGQALGFLKARRDKPFFLLVDTLDTHPPYYWQKPDSAFPPAVRAVKGGLAKSLNQLDDNLRAFFAGLKADGLWDDQTLVVITADHFPAFGPEPLVLSGASGYGTNRIPMIFVTKAKAALSGLDEERLGSQLDLAPTLADLMGLPTPPTFMGRDLLSPGAGRALGRERELLRLRLADGPEQDTLLDGQGLPLNADTPLARWYRWRLGQL